LTSYPSCAEAGQGVKNNRRLALSTPPTLPTDAGIKSFPRTFIAIIHSQPSFAVLQLVKEWNQTFGAVYSTHDADSQYVLVSDATNNRAVIFQPDGESNQNAPSNPL